MPDAGEAVPLEQHPLAVFRHQIDEEPPRLRELRSDLPRGLEAVAARSMGKDPGQR
jgi:hypothetical protein